MFHKIILVGNLGASPEMRYTPSGKAVTNFSIATNEKWTDADGAAQERVVWWRISAWGRLAEVCNEYLSKGRQVLVEGRMKADESGNPRVYTRNDGTPGASYEVTASTVKFLGGGNGQAGGAPQSEDIPPAADVDDNDIPF